MNPYCSPFRYLLGFCVLLSAWPAAHVAAQSEYQGTYVGYAYVTLQGAVNQPETATGTVIAEVSAAGEITLLDGTTGTVDAGGIITWDQPNDLFLTAGDITDGTLNGSGSTTGSGITTLTRIELKAGGGFNAADSLDEVFELINPENLLQNGVRVIHDGTQFVAMSENGTVSFSSDGLSWTSRSTGAIHPIRDFAYGDGTYVAVGEQNTILTSTDLETWTARSSGIGDIQNWTLHTVDFFNGRFYIGNTIGAVARSSNATAATWEAPVIVGDAISGLGATIKIRAVNGVLIVAGKPLFNPSRVVMYSNDGTNFTESTIDVAFASTAAQIFPYSSEGIDYIIINFSSHWAFSQNGASFNAVANPQNFGYMAFDGNRFIARTLGSGAQFYHSTTLQTWTLDANTAFAGVVDTALADGVIVGVGTTGRVAPNLTDWQPITTSPINRLPGGNNLRTVYGNGRHIVYDAGDSFITTDNGESWEQTGGHARIVFGNGVFFNGSHVSVDGKTWTPVNVFTNEDETASFIGFDGSVFLVNSTQSRIYTSSDGFQWEYIGSGFAQNSHTLVGHQGEWLALRTGGAYSRSLDGGATWTSHTISNSTLNGAVYGNGRWVMVTQNGRIRSSESADGSFPEVGPVLTQGGDLTSVVFVDGQFVVYRENFRTYLISPTGLPGSWQEKTFAYATRMNAAAAGPDTTLITGHNNIVLRLDAPSVGHPVVTAPPVEEITLTQDDTLSLSAAAIGDGPLSYRWYRNSIPLQNLGRVSGADTPELQISDMRGSDAGVYHLRIFNANGSVITHATDVAVNLKPVVLTAPQSFTVADGGSVVLEVEASEDTTAIQWFKDGVLIPGATDATLEITGFAEANAGIYEARLSNNFGDTFSPPASLSYMGIGSGLAYDTDYAANLPAFSITSVHNFGSFPSTVGMLMHKILPMPDGKVVIAGLFRYNSASGIRNGILRLNADGTLDTSFQVPTTEFFQNSAMRDAAFVDAALLSDGRVVAVSQTPVSFIGGTFYNSAPRVLLFNTDGSVDLTFAPTFTSNATINAVAVDSQDRILIGGTNLTPGTTRSIARFSTAGVLDTTFNGAAAASGINMNVIRTKCMEVVDNDELWVIGNRSSATVSAKVTSSGTLAVGVASANFGPSNQVINHLTPTSDGGFLVAGNFTTVSSTARNRLAKIQADGTLDPVLVPQIPFVGTPNPRGVVALSDDSIVMGGHFFIEVESGYLTQIALLNEQGALNLDSSTEVETQLASTIHFIMDVAASADGNTVFLGRGVTASNDPDAPRLLKFNAGAIDLLPGVPDLQILTVSGGGYAEPGDYVALAVAAVGGDLSFQWFRNGQPIDGATSATLVIPSVGVEHAGDYTVEVSDSRGALESTPVSLDIPGAPPAPATFAEWPALLDLPENQRGPNATPAGDGVANLIKYAIGIGPLDSAAGRIPQEVLEGSLNDETYPVVCFVRDTTAAGVTMQIKVSTDLDFSADIGSTIAFIEDLGNGLERVCVRSNASFAEETRQFFILEVDIE